jgi:F0F1-type ATP synthase membrane subunit a
LSILAEQIFSSIQSVENSISHLFQKTRGVLAPFLVFVEFIRLIIRPVTLSIRLIANLRAGHIVGRRISTKIIFPLLWETWERGVSVIQTTVIILLWKAYWSEN